MAGVIDALSGLINQMTGLGGGTDKGAAGVWGFDKLADGTLEAVYRASWMAKKAVNIPAYDMIREGWTWEAESAQIERIEQIEKRFKVRRKVFEALSAARLYGGAGLVISDGAPDPRLPLENVRRNSIRLVVPVSRRYLIGGKPITDPNNPDFGFPEFYQMTTSAGMIDLHHSRVIRFDGEMVPDLMVRGEANAWGDSVLDSVNAAISDATAGQQGIAALIQEAKIDIIKVPGLTGKIATEGYEQRLLKRFALMQHAKGIVNATLIDGEEEHEQKTVNFSQLPDVLRLLLQIVSGAADIPVTRFLGQSPAGLNATGDSDIRNYYDALKAEQELELRPKLDRLFDILIGSELGNRPDGMTFTFDPLWQMDEKEISEIEKRNAETDQIFANSGLVPLPVLETGIRNRLIESRLYPGIEAAFEDFDTNPEEDDRRIVREPDPGDVEEEEPEPEGDDE